MKNSILMTLLLLLTPLVSLPMSFLKNIFAYKNMKSHVPVVQSRTRYSKSIDYVKGKLDYIRQEKERVQTELQKIPNVKANLSEKLRATEQGIASLKTLDNVRHSLADDLRQISDENDVFNAIDKKYMDTSKTNALPNNDLQLGLLQELIEKEKAINKLKEELNTKYSTVFTSPNESFKLPEE
ncbi:MAG TPA: hypothetical protein VL201_05265 [Patescibacteria group bacterium]|jgi:DNA repair ATPase RecN|nr:hypothetical protein [Patescibacteria group bacterium]